MADNKMKSIGKEIFEWIYSIVIAIIIAFLIKSFLFDIVKVDGKSMFPTLEHKDRLIVTKLGYDPKQGDIIILDSNYNNRNEYYAALAKAEGKD
jgi:signal peptidase I